MLSANNEDLNVFYSKIKESLLQIFINESNDDPEKTWLMEHTANSLLKKRIPQISILGLHTLEVICQNEGIKGLDIAHKLNVTKGAISKITHKLLEYGLITRSQRPNNLKEVYFFKTSLGLELSALHQKLHEDLDQRGFALLEKYDLASLRLISDFLNELVTVLELSSPR